MISETRREIVTPVTGSVKNLLARTASTSAIIGCWVARMPEFGNLTKFACAIVPRATYRTSTLYEYQWPMLRDVLVRTVRTQYRCWFDKRSGTRHTKKRNFFGSHPTTTQHNKHNNKARHSVKPKTN